MIRYGNRDFSHLMDFQHLVLKINIFCLLFEFGLYRRQELTNDCRTLEVEQKAFSSLVIIGLQTLCSISITLYMPIHRKQQSYRFIVKNTSV